MFDYALIELPLADGVGAFSRSQCYGVWEVYRHLQGDNYYVAEHLIERTREFFSSAADAVAWVEARPQRKPSAFAGPRVWTPRTHFSY